MATVPILMLPLVRIFYRERLTWRGVGGALLAVGGVAILFLR
jgi:drug/metabolite transporter (DMT)-like permease